MKTLVLGASTNPDRYSYKAINKLRNHGYEVVAIGNKNGIVNDVNIETKPIDLFGIDTITLYLNPIRQREYYEYIISLNPRRVIFNPGAENIELTNLLETKNINIEIACTLVLLATGQY